MAKDKVISTTPNKIIINRKKIQEVLTAEEIKQLMTIINKLYKLEEEA